MKNYQKLLAFIILLLLSNLCIAQRYLMKQEVTQELDIVQETLLNIHPALIDDSERNLFVDQVDKMKSEVPDSLSIRDHFLLLNKLLNLVHCGHLGILKLGNKKNTAPHKLFPFSITKKGNAFIIDKNYAGEEYDTWEGCEIISINDKSVTEVIPLLSQYKGPTDYLYEGVLIDHAVKYFQSRYFFFFGEVESFKIIAKNKTTGQTSTFEITATNNLQKKNNSNIQNIQLTFDSISNVAILKVRKFSDDKFLGRFNTKFRREVRRAMKKIESKSINKLVIDLRDNGGGEHGNLVYLLRHFFDTKFSISSIVYSNINTPSQNIGLKNKVNFLFRKTVKKKNILVFPGFMKQYKPKRRANYSKDIVVLMNSNTFSAANMFCSIMKERERGILAGEVSGGGHLHTYGGLFITLPLKNSQSIIRIPLLKIQQNFKNDILLPSNLEPDIVIANDGTPNTDHLDSDFYHSIKSIYENQYVE